MYAYDPEIERNARRRLAVLRRHGPPPAEGARPNLMAEEGEQPRNNQPQKTLREIMFLNNNSLRPLGITLPNITDNWELRHSFI